MRLQTVCFIFTVFSLQQRIQTILYKLCICSYLWNLVSLKKDTQINHWLHCFMQCISMHSVIVNCWINHKLNFQSWCYLYHIRTHHTPAPCTKTVVVKAFSETYYNEKIRKNSHFSLLYYRLASIKMSSLHLITQIKISLSGTYKSPVIAQGLGSSKCRGRCPCLRDGRTRAALHKNIYFSLVIALTALAREDGCREHMQRELTWPFLRTNTGIFLPK